MSVAVITLKGCQLLSSNTMIGAWRVGRPDSAAGLEQAASPYGARVREHHRYGDRRPRRVDGRTFFGTSPTSVRFCLGSGHTAGTPRERR